MGKFTFWDTKHLTQNVTKYMTQTCDGNLRQSGTYALH